MTPHVTSLLVVAGIHGAGKSHLVKSMRAGETPAPFGISGIADWKNSKAPKFFIERAARRTSKDSKVKNSILQLSVFSVQGAAKGDPGQTYRRLSDLFRNAAELRCVTVVADYSLIMERLQERMDAEHHGKRVPVQRAPEKLYPSVRDVVGHYDAWLRFIGEFGPAGHVLVDSSGPDLEFLPLSAWEESIRPGMLQTDRSVL